MGNSSAPERGAEEVLAGGRLRKPSCKVLDNQQQAADAVIAARQPHHAATGAQEAVCPAAGATHGAPVVAGGPSVDTEVGKRPASPQATQAPAEKRAKAGRGGDNAWEDDMEASLIRLIHKNRQRANKNKMLKGKDKYAHFARALLEEYGSERATKTADQVAAKESNMKAQMKEEYNRLKAQVRAAKTITGAATNDDGEVVLEQSPTRDDITDALGDAADKGSLKQANFSLYWELLGDDPTFHKGPAVVSVGGAKAKLPAAGAMDGNTASNESAGEGSEGSGTESNATLRRAARAAAQPRPSPLNSELANMFKKTEEQGDKFNETLSTLAATMSAALQVQMQTGATLNSALTALTGYLTAYSGNSGGGGGGWGMRQLQPPAWQPQFAGYTPPPPPPFQASQHGQPNDSSWNPGT